MPALAAHYYFGRKVLKALPNPLHQLILRNEKAYNLGLQGPDIFFAFKPFTSDSAVAKIGSRLHKEERGTFMQRGIELIASDQDHAVSAYLMGMICHFKLDDECHPLIESKCNNYEEHFRLETALDCRVLELNGEDPMLFKRYNLVETDDSLCQSLTSLYPSLTARMIGQAVRSMRLYNKLLYSPSQIKLGVIKFLEKVATGKNTFSALAISKSALGSFPQEVEQLLSLYQGAVHSAAKSLMAIYNQTQS